MIECNGLRSMKRRSFRGSLKSGPVPPKTSGLDQHSDDRSGLFTASTYAGSHLRVREMKVDAERYDSVLTLLRLPPGSDVWPPRDFGTGHMPRSKP